MFSALGRCLVSTALLMCACNSPPSGTSSPPAAPPAPPAAPKVEQPVVERMTADSPRATPSGTTFKAPAGFTMKTTGQMVELGTPEPDSRVAIIDTKAKTANDAVAAGWALFRPTFKRAIKLVAPRPARQGWDERQYFTYDSSPNERVSISAAAMRRGEQWTVMLIDATEPTAERRAAPLDLIANSLRPKGYVRESFAGKKANPLDKDRIKQLAEFIEFSRKELQIPGVSLGLIDQGKVVFSGGFGVRELGKPTPVDGDTLYLVASNTKGLTTLMLAKLIDEGKLRWDMPVVDVFPGFKLGNAETTSRVLIKHLVCACTGLPRQDLEWMFGWGKATANSTMGVLGQMQPTTNFGEVFQYSNHLAAAAGFVGAHVAEPKLELGAAYDAAMQRLVFKPLGMKSATFDFAKAERGNHARPHGLGLDGKLAVEKMNFNYAIVPLRPAGGAWLSVNDLLRYVQMELSRGRLPDGKQFVSEENLLARRIPQVGTGEDTVYGMGLRVDSIWGVPIVHHTGYMIGYHTDMIFLPDYGIGAVFMTNSDPAYALLDPFIRRLVEVIFDGRPEAAEEVSLKAREQQEQLQKLRARLTVAADAALLAKLAPRYSNQQLGDITIKKQGAGLTFDFGDWTSEMAWSKNADGTLSLISIEPGLVEGFEYIVGEKDGKRSLSIRDAQHEYVYLEVK